MVNTSSRTINRMLPRGRCDTYESHWATRLSKTVSLATIHPEVFGMALSGEYHTPKFYRGW